MDDWKKKVFEEACSARKNAYAPYSKFLVGAAWKIKNNDKIFSGFNIENSSFGATVCAERTAMFRAITELGQKPDFEFLVVVTDTKPATLPCALCLQVMAEFCDPELPIHVANTKGIERSLKFKDLLPHPFDTLNAPKV